MADLIFDYSTVKISDIVVDTSPVPNHPNKTVVNHVTINDEAIIPSKRFWASLCSRFSNYGVTQNLYQLFTYEEVFNRLSERSPNDRVRITVQREELHAPILLAATSPEKPMIAYDSLMDILDRYNAEHVTYSDGMVTSWHTPRIGGHQYTLVDEYNGKAEHHFENRYMLEVPIDAYGKPCVFPSVQRMDDCTRWVTRNATSLKNEISLGKGLDVVAHAVARVMDSFNSDEGYAILRNRLDMAFHTWASVYEINEAYKLVTRLMGNMLINGQNRETVQTGGGLLAAFHEMTGDTSKIYGLATLDTLAAKKQRGLPVNCTMYQLLGFLAHAATYDARIEGANALHCMIGQIMGDTVGLYDLEGMRKKFRNFSDFHLHSSLRDVLEGHAKLK